MEWKVYKCLKIFESDSSKEREIKRSNGTSYRNKEDFGDWNWRKNLNQTTASLKLEWEQMGVLEFKEICYHLIPSEAARYYYYYYY